VNASYIASDKKWSN